jgi:hypothetical protein
VVGGVARRRPSSSTFFILFDILVAIMLSSLMTATQQDALAMASQESESQVKEAA